MNKLLLTLLKDTEVIEMVEPSIYSVLPESERVQHYDKSAVMYDRVIGNRFYNKLIWGNWPNEYHGFCLQGLNSRKGLVLDGGCGSLVFTAKAYAQSQRPVVLTDISLEMLRRAKARVVKLLGEVPEYMVFVQADLLKLPFHPHSFETVHSFGMMHIFEDSDAFIHALANAKKEGGSMFVTSLSANSGFSRKYLNMLKKHEEVALCESTESLCQRITKAGPVMESKKIGNISYFSQA